MMALMVCVEMKIWGRCRPGLCLVQWAFICRSRQNVYVIGSPLFETATLNLGEEYGNRKFVVQAHHVSKENQYIQTAKLNGNPLLRPWITHDEIVRGGMLEFEMGPEPNKNWGASPEDAPPSAS